MPVNITDEIDAYGDDEEAEHEDHEATAFDHRRQPFEFGQCQLTIVSNRR